MIHPQLPGPIADFGAEQTEVRVWLVQLDQPTEELMPLLSSDELARAQRFHFADHRQRFVAARGLLRILLAAYLDTDPASLRFEYGPQGKPSLIAAFGQVSFNLSHAVNWSIVAIARGGQIGVDLEAAPANGVESYPLEGVCSDRERAYLMSLPAPARQREFLSFWTRKEALVKADGRGIPMVPLNQVEVLGETVGGQPGPFLVETVPLASGAWWIEDLQLPGNLVAALAADYPFPTPVCWTRDTRLLLKGVRGSTSAST